MLVHVHAQHGGWNVTLVLHVVSCRGDGQGRVRWNGQGLGRKGGGRARGQEDDRKPVEHRAEVEATGGG